MKIVILLVLHYVGLTQHIHKELPDSAYFDFLRLKTELLPILHINAEDVQEYLHDKEGFFASFLIQNAHLGMQQKFDLIKKELIASYPDYVTHKKTYIPQPAPTVVNGPCTNIDFENGTTSGWQGTTGIACNRDQPCNQVPGFSATRHVITSAGTTDPYIPTLSTVYPGGGGSSIRIEDYASGSDLGLRNGNATTLSQTFMVTPDNNLFTYHYAAVLEDPDDHDDAERPYFKVRMYDESGAEIACASY
ncbi:MAG TPA: hypothetical protein VL947_12920, partial [Cytophagales bacterium]|nr:hypothetical protein [Cytophagales bacterium]